MRQQKQLLWVKNLLFDLLAGLAYGVGISVFAKNAHFAPGGISGLSLIANHLWGVPVGLTNLLLNLPLIALSYKFVGRRFLLRTFVSVSICTVYVDFVFPHLPGYTGSPFLAAIYSGLCLGLCLALLYMRGSSSGGIDLLVMSIKVLRPHLTLGSLTMAVDAFIILTGGFVFGNVDAVLYGIVSSLTCSMVIDKVMYGMGTGKLVVIITDKGPEVSREISREADRGSTILQATGAYTGKALQVLLCACTKAEAFKVRSCAHEVDKHSFVMIADTSEVYGEGFIDPRSSTGLPTES